MKNSALIAFIVAVILSGSVAFGEDAEALYQQGLISLRLAQSDHSALVPATKLLAKAASLFELAGDETKNAEVNSCLYWAKKKMTLADAESFKGNAEVSKRLESTAKVIPVSESQAMLDRANAFAQGHADDPLLVAIRYYEVGDRFKDSDIGRNAIDASLKFMQLVGEKAKLAAYKPAATDGKAYVTSDPPGAAIILVDANGRQDLGKKTPSLVQLPKGTQSLSIEKEGTKPQTISVEIADIIAKPAIVKLEAVLIPVDIVFEDGWLVFLDGKPAADNTGKMGSTPCTIETPMGKHTLLLAKEGYQDFSQPIDVKEQTTVELKQKPSKGVSATLKASDKLAIPKDGKLNKIVVWNGHNAQFNNSGTKTFDIRLSLGGNVVFKKDDVAMEWDSKQDPSVTIDLPNIKFDTVRVSITANVGGYGCLSEIQVFVGGINIALNKKVRASGVNANPDHRDSEQKINDGITTSTTYKRGYWVANDGPNYIEIDLTKDKSAK